MAVTIDHISKYYGKQKALDNISFTLNKGEVCGFLGPNGAGKSTTMKIITGFLEDFTGQVQVCGMDIRKQPLRVKACIGYLPEHNPLYPEMFINEYLLHIEKGKRDCRTYRIATGRKEENRRIIQRVPPTCRTGTGIGSQPGSVDSGRTDDRARSQSAGRNTSFDYPYRER
mgnify:CR=1 FL=1